MRVPGRARRRGTDAMTTGLLGGTFDPLHNGHLRLAIECLESVALRQVRLVPVHLPPHRDAPVASPDQRLDMVRLAVNGIPGLVADAAEVQRGGVSYTIDTLRALRGSPGREPMALIIGMDAFAMLNTWRQWTELLDLVHIIVVHRPGADATAFDPEIRNILEQRRVHTATELGSQPAGNVHLAKLPLLDISATGIRSRLARGRNVSGLVPDPVLQYIHRHSLYGTTG